MRKFVLTALLSLGAAFPSPAQTSVREKVAAYYRGWFAHIPGSEVTVKPTREVIVPGLEAYRVERPSSSKSHQEASITLYDAASAEVFVGDVLGDPARAAANRPFDPARDLPDIQASLAEAFGLPVQVEIGSPPRGALIPISVWIRQAQEKDSAVARKGFVSRDGSALMLGEFHPLAAGPAAFRERLLSETDAVRADSGKTSFTVTEFLDFQCDRCRVRTPDVRREVEAKGGAVETRFLPLVKTHNWAFAAAESAAALANVRPALYRAYEEAIFARSEGMNPAAARELASDIAESSGVRDAFAAELASGRARARVVRDIGLAMRLGVFSTPAFLYRGTLLPGERGYLETYLWESLSGSRAKPPGPPR